MSAAEAPTLETIAIERIAVEEDHNPRTQVNPDRLEELTASVAEHGVVQAITVRRSEAEGRYVVVSGHRRLAAAKQAGLEAVPALVREDNGNLAAAIAENLIREDLDVIEEANALTRLAEIEGLNRKALSQRVSKSVSYVGERVRLLELPTSCQEHFAAGRLPLAAEKPLRQVAKVAPRVAEHLADFAVERERVDALIGDLGSLVLSLSSAIEDGHLADPPTLIDLSRGRIGSDIVEDAEERAALEERYEAACAQLGVSARYYSYGYSEEAGPLPVRVSQESLDAADAAGVLLRVSSDSDWHTDFPFIVDREFAADVIRREVEAAERAAGEHREKVEAEAAERGEDAPADPTDEDAIREERRREGEERKRAQLRAARHNERLGAALLKRRGAESRKKHSLARAKAVAKIVLAAEPKLAGRGLRYALPQLREVEVRTLKSGETREKLTLAEPDAAQEYLLGRIERARSAQEVLEELADALIAAERADQREMPRSKGVQFWNPTIRDAVDDELAPDAKGAKIRRPAGERR